MTCGRGVARASALGSQLRRRNSRCGKARIFPFIMEIPVVASAGAAASVYYYNLDRFKFDAEQRQTCIYQVQSMRLAQWGLFREDVHDVFGLSTSSMDNYILVGALVVTAVMNFIFVGYPAFPPEPRWLLPMWNNTVFACITFGMLCVWLGMHGSISQRSAKASLRGGWDPGVFGLVLTPGATAGPSSPCKPWT